MDEDGNPKFSPYVAQVTAKAMRSVRTGQYESFEISTLIQAEPDRRFTMRENVVNLNALVKEEVNRVAAEIEATLEVST